MPEIARILAFISAFLMVMSFAIWFNWLRGPLLQRLDGLRVSNAGAAGFAVRLLMLALVVSAVAAALAIVGWISP
jgi:hypothetical protein